MINNGYFSENSELSRGVKQGFPLSPCLFVMNIEWLSIKIRSNDKIKGLEINGLETKVSMYAVNFSLKASIIPKLYLNPVFPVVYLERHI
jgi:hypothetical protein